MSNNSYYNDAWRIINEKNQSLVSNYSMQFDGSGNDSIAIPSYTIPENSTVSFWVKSSLTNPQDIIISGAAGHYYPYLLLSGNNIRLLIKAGGTSSGLITDVPWVADTWFHIAITGENGQGAGSTATYYINGVSKGTSLHRAPTLTVIGDYTTSSLAWNGQIDQVCFFDYALPATGTNSIATLYGGGTAVTNPMALSPKPVAYYQLGDQSVDNGANYLVPNNSLNGIEGYSPYALSFDGTNQEFDIPSVSTLELYNTDFSISFWCKVDASVSNPMFFEKYTAGGGWALYVNNDLLRFYNGSGWTYISGAFQTVYAGLWTNVTVVGDLASTNLKCYINGNQVHSSTNTLIQIQNTSILTMAGSNGNAFSYAGELSNVAIWSGTALSAAQVTEVYNQGVPTNLNTFSGNKPNHWWQLGSNSSFNSNSWTCLDEGISASTIPLTSAVSTTNMAEDDITNGVGYSANGLGTSSIEIIGDAPYSTANAISENMDVLDRTTDLPPTV